MSKPVVRSVTNYPGGKCYLKREIIGKFFSTHTRYVEGFAGSGAVLLAKPRVADEWLFDLSPDVVNFHICVRDHPVRLARDCEEVVRSVEAFQRAKLEIDQPFTYFGDVARARDWLMLRRFSRNGTGLCFARTTRERDGQPRWDRMIPRISRAAARLQGVKIVVKCALDLIGESDLDRFDTLWYFDPPYMHSTRVSRALYEIEQDDEFHENFLDAVQKLRGQVVISGYDHPLYNVKLRDWRRTDHNVFNAMGNQAKVKTRRTEVLWINL